MKKGSFLRKILFGLFIISFLLVYLWIYVFPSIGAVSRTKREIKEQSLLIMNARTEKLIFAESDKRERLLFRIAEHEFSRSMKPPAGGNLESIKFLLKEIGVKAGITGLRFSDQKNVRDKQGGSPDAGLNGIQVSPLEMDFYAGLRYGTEFIRLISFTGHYILFENMEARRSGSGFTFKVNTEVLYTDPEGKSLKKESNGNPEDLIDMDSPLLKQPVHQSTFRVKKQNPAVERGRK